MTYLTDKELARFRSKYVEDSKGCWIWQDSLDRDGYGSMYFRRVDRRAHRVAWYMQNGEIPEGFVINHTCRVRSCVNPQHLQCVTIRDNALKDSASVSYINSQKTHCKYGHPLDRVYGGQRYCSTCDAAKKKRLRQKWKAEDTLKV